MKALVIILSLQWGMWSNPSTPNAQVSLHKGFQHHSQSIYSLQESGSTYLPSSSFHQLSKLPLSNRHWARPGKWCGWYMRKKLGVADPKYNLARNWARWGQASPPQVGAVVVWRNHVGQIVGRNQQGQWLIESGNDGGKVKTRPWNLSKVIAYRI